jgi:hypothetical protein
MEERYMAALERLKQRSLASPPAQDGATQRTKFKISNRSVAKEAGLSHSPLSRGGYPKVCAAIKDCSTTIRVLRKGKLKRIRELTASLAEAEIAKSKLATQVAFLTLRCSELERKLKRTLT